MLLSAHHDQPFDALPTEIVEEIFQRALAAPLQEIAYGETTPTRLSLSHVCRRWKGVLQSHICIEVPEKRHLLFTKHASRSGKLTSRIYSLAQFAGPLRLSIVRDMDIEGDWSEELQSLAVALGAAHRATIILRFHYFPLKDLQYLMMGTECQVFARITSLSISDPLLSDPTLILRPTTVASRNTMPQFPVLTHLALYETSIAPASIQDIRWSWLFQSSVCDNLLSFSANPIRATDVSWLLTRTPHLLDLSVSTNGGLDNGQNMRPVIAHQNLKKLFLGFGYSSPVVCCPNLTTLTSYLPTPDDDQATPPKLDPSVNLTTLSLHFTENVATSLRSFGPNLSTLTNLYIASASASANTLSQIVDVVGGNLLPNLLHLFLHLSPPSTTPLSGSSIPLLFLISNSLRRLTQPHGAKAELLTIDYRIPRSVATRPALLHLVSLLRGAADRDLMDLRADFDESFDPYAELLSLDAVLDTEPQVALSKVAGGWTAFVKGIERWTVPHFPVYELLVAAPLFLDLFGRVKDVFEGTSFDSHADIVDRWKMEVGELERRSWTAEKTKQWRIGAVPDPLYMKLEGLYWGRQQGDSLIYDLRGEMHYYFTEYRDFVFDHEVGGLLESPSDLVLTSLGVQP